MISAATCCVLGITNNGVIAYTGESSWFIEDKEYSSKNVVEVSCELGSIIELNDDGTLFLSRNAQGERSRLHGSI